MSNLKLHLSQVIVSTRTKAHLSQEQVALKAGLSRSYYSDIERGLRNVSIETLSEVARALGTTASALLAKAEEARDKMHHSYTPETGETTDRHEVPASESN
jgi:transcriptional regulator with XRE-family HTH domain